MVEVKVATSGARRIRNGHLWIYRSDILTANNPEGGSIVRVVDEAGNFVGQAFYSDASQIALRLLSTRDETIDRDWWRTRLRQCANRRANIAKETNAYRMVYSEGDLLPSIIIDVYNGNYVLQTLSQGAARVQDDLVELLVEEFKLRSILERNDAPVRRMEGLELRCGVLYEAGPEPRLVGVAGGSEGPSCDAANTIEINQHGVRFLVAPLSAQKTGAFLDQRENYLATRNLAHGRALDCFTFHGGFALHISSVCEHVLGIDLSATAIAAAQSNADINGIKNADFQVANVFDALREMEATGERYDTIILDPPAFTKSRATIKSGARGYKEINLRALKLLNAGGILVTCTCSYHMGEEMFLDIVADAAIDARRRVQIIEKRGQSSDHPVLLGVPETHYLKCVIARVIQ